METLADLVAAARNRDGAFLDIPGRQTAYSHREFCTNAWKAASLLGQYGAHSGGEVAVGVGPKDATAGAEAGSRQTDDGATDSRQTGDGTADGRQTGDGTADGRQPGTVDAADPLFAILGGALVGATVTTTPTSPVAARVLVCPAAWRDSYETAAACSTLVYGTDGAVGGGGDSPVPQFDRERWSESPVEPPERVTGEMAVVRGDGDAYSHAEMLAAAEAAIDRYDIDDASRVGVRADLRRPGVLAAGVLAPLRVGATVVPAGPAGGVGEATPTVTFVGRSASDDSADGRRAGNERYPAPTLEGLLGNS